MVKNAAIILRYSCDDSKLYDSNLDSDSNADDVDYDDAEDIPDFITEDRREALSEEEEAFEGEDSAQKVTAEEVRDDAEDIPVLLEEQQNDLPDDPLEPREVTSNGGIYGPADPRYVPPTTIEANQNSDMEAVIKCMAFLLLHFSLIDSSRCAPKLLPENNINLAPTQQTLHRSRGIKRGARQIAGQ